MNIIQTRNLTKTYYRFEKQAGLKGSIRSLVKRKKSAKTAINGFDLKINEGEFAALIGPNGAGKTTLFKMLAGIIAPSFGEISVLGYYPNDLKNEFKRQFSIVMGQKSQLFFDLTAADVFLLIKEIYDIDDLLYRENLEYFIEKFKVKDYLDVQVRTLSLGERMKMELIAALLHSPKVLFLDEPTIGLDAIAQMQIRDFLREVNADKKTTILLTSHYMDDIKSLCKRCIVINEGNKIYDGSLIKLFEKYQVCKVITVVFDRATKYSPISKVQMIEQNPYKVSFKANKKDVGALLCDIMARCEINDISVEEEDIGNVVERIYQTNEGSIING